MRDIREKVLNHHASRNTVYHCLYGYYYLGYSKARLAKIYAKHPSTITSWINSYERNECFDRKERAKVYLRFGTEERTWIVNTYRENPVLFLDEAKFKFTQRFQKSISTASISRILLSEGYTWKVLERRAVQLRQTEIYRFFIELNEFHWDIHNLLFLDEVSCDNRSMLRTKGYAPVGEKLVYRGEFVRRPRCSLLSFLGCNGILETYSTEGTFTRAKFFDCIRQFISSGKAKQYPGQYSLWIMDGARIHCHRSIVEYLRSMGIIVIFLPAYAPFYNPIELVFGYIKKYLKRTYVENSSEDLAIIIAKAFKSFKNRDCVNIFRKAGYLPGGTFDPSIGLCQNNV
ncbi:uncharacterized protein LOC134222390 [Armigeres subalbatus]|uniref:uncharacterized protein LOC134222067 n=1 Tax=Armigeres subalbatus TaxID=124917 RepID=UPI002ED0DE20